MSSCLVWLVPGHNKPPNAKRHKEGKEGEGSPPVTVMSLCVERLTHIVPF